MRLAFREVWTAFRRAPGLGFLSVFTIAFSLFAFGLFGLVAYNTRLALERLEERVEIRAYVLEGTETDAVAAAVGDVRAFPEVASVTYVTPEDALKKARTEMAEFQDVFEPEFLPASLEVRLKPGMRTPDQVKAVSERLAGYSFVDDVRYGEEWVQKFYSVRRAATAAGIVLGIAFALAAMIIIGSTIRTSVLARSREIGIMRLVGATDGFIRAPFLIDGLMKGLIGGVLAVTFMWITRTALTATVFSFEFFPTPVLLLGILVGALIGFLGSALSVGRQLKRI
ncbi:MAG TPA: permease-like cell division protein FtsX [Gemmatimonadaceae bacterium]|nr:permease-like cell division protein FtsX [Gemmatimonadaceae bacterium]